jgi:hypothetical protein
VHPLLWLEALWRRQQCDKQVTGDKAASVLALHILALRIPFTRMWTNWTTEDRRSRRADFLTSKHEPGFGETQRSG